MKWRAFAVSTNPSALEHSHSGPLTSRSLKKTYPGTPGADV
jgi:hypothetical protein